MKKYKLFGIILLSSLLASCGNTYEDVEPVTFKEDDNKSTNEVVAENKEDYITLCDNDNFKFEFRNDSDVLKIQDKRNNYTWYTGRNLPQDAYDGKLGDLNRNERKEFIKNHEEIEMNITSYYYSLITSLITIQYYTVSTSSANSLLKYYGSSLEGVESKLYKVSDSHYKFSVDYSTLKDESVDVQIVADLLFDNNGFEVQILNENITGSNANNIRNILICPFLGATGGSKGISDGTSGFVEEEREWIDGYVLVPDGCGSLIEMTNNNVENLSSYLGYVYGLDPAHSRTYSTTVAMTMVIKEAKMPVFGVAREKENAAFVSYAKSGAEYMSIMMSPDNSNQLQYAWVTPQFNYNFEYTEIYNKAGDSYSKIADNRNQFDLDIKYDFLANENANYVGMAKDYRNYLIGEGTLTEKEYSYDNIPCRLDFIMSDVEDSIVGNKEIVTTTASDLDDILQDVIDNLHIDNGIVSLSGWQKGGKATQHPGKARFASSIGSKGRFENLIEKYKDNFDITFQQNYYLINTEQMAYLNNASKHINGYYQKVYDFFRQYISEFAISRPDRSYDFVKSQIDKVDNMGLDSFTIEGISSYLTSNYTTISREMAKHYIQAAFNYVKSKGVKVNAIEPNNYLWKYVDRYLDADPYDSVLLIETTEVPFLQLVLQGTMELFAKYSNFSFYDENSICTMVDFNMYPSFMLTNESAYYLLQTNSNNYFSTQYEVFKPLIDNVYSKVNSALSKVVGAKWIDRKVDNNVVTNTYSNGKKIVINYNKNDVVIDGKTIGKESFEVI